MYIIQVIFMHPILLDLSSYPTSHIVKLQRCTNVVTTLLNTSRQGVIHNVSPATCVTRVCNVLINDNP